MSRQPSWCALRALSSGAGRSTLHKRCPLGALPPAGFFVGWRTEMRQQDGGRPKSSGALPHFSRHHRPRTAPRCRTSPVSTGAVCRRAAALLAAAPATEAAHRTAALAPISASADGPPGSLTHLRAAAASRAAASLVVRRCSFFKAPESLLSPLLWAAGRWSRGGF